MAAIDEWEERFREIISPLTFSYVLNMENDKTIKYPYKRLSFCVITSSKCSFVPGEPSSHRHLISSEFESYEEIVNTLFHFSRMSNVVYIHHVIGHKKKMVTFGEGELFKISNTE